MTAWQEHAACAGMDTDLFYDPARTDQARQICNRCPVQAQCLDYVQAQQPVAAFDFGVWGGTVPGDRDHRPAPAGRPPLLTELEAHAAHARVQTGGEGVRAVAATLNVTPKTLYRTWKQHGLSSPTEPDWQPRPRRSRAWEDRQIAEAAFALAETDGMKAAMRQTGHSDDTLLRAWEHWGMGRPDTRQAAARRKCEAAQRIWQRRAVPA